MFDARKPIQANGEIINKIENIKTIISNELQGFEGDLEIEWNRLFQLYISQDEELSLITNI